MAPAPACACQRAPGRSWGCTTHGRCSPAPTHDAGGAGAAPAYPQLHERRQPRARRAHTRTAVMKRGAGVRKWAIPHGLVVALPAMEACSRSAWGAWGIWNCLILTARGGQGSEVRSPPQDPPRPRHPAFSAVLRVDAPPRSCLSDWPPTDLLGRSGSGAVRTGVGRSEAGGESRGHMWGAGSDAQRQARGGGGGGRGDQGRLSRDEGQAERERPEGGHRQRGTSRGKAGCGSWQRHDGTGWRVRGRADGATGHEERTWGDTGTGAGGQGQREQRGRGVAGASRAHGLEHGRQRARTTGILEWKPQVASAAICCRPGPTS